MSNMINATGQHGPAGWSYRHPSTVEPFSFEEIDLYWWAKFAALNWKLSVYAGAIYVVTIFGLQHWMKSRPAMNLKAALFLWNAALGIFSIMGFVRTAPALWDTLGKSNGLYTSICKKNYLDTALGYWLLMFSLSKFVELGDTVFIVLRKRPLIFLQWYHHIVTMNLVWILGSMVEPISVIAMFLNYAVHAMMYPYFALTVIGFKIPKKLVKFITTCQFAQMIIMFVVNAMTTYYYQVGEDCTRTPASIKAFGIVYGSFAILFGKLFIDSVITGRMKKTQGAKCDNDKNK